MPLYVLATPIGNLDDISHRALKILEESDCILAEDTRRIRILLSHFRISKKVISFHQFSEEKKIQSVLALLKNNQSIALVSDAGTPTISDPGTKLVDAVYAKLPGDSIIPIPGPSAVIAALSVSGFSSHAFCFVGYAPKRKKRRETFFSAILASSLTGIFFSPPHGILEDLTDLKNAIASKERRLFVAREMTKKFETLYRGNISEVLAKVMNDPQKGEYTVVVEGER